MRKLFTEALVRRGDITLDEAEAALDDFQHRLQQALDETRLDRSGRRAGGQARRRPAGVLPHVDTGVDRATLDAVFDHFTDYPEGFTPHPKLARQFEARSKLYHEQGEVEWATAELLAFASLVLEGIPVRLSRRGQPARHVQPAPRQPRRLRDRQDLGADRHARRQEGQVLGLRLAAVGVRRRSGSSTATRWPRRTRSCCGRRSSATS